MVSSDKVFRRVKDVIDLYYVSKVFDLDKDAVMQTLQDSGRSLGTFHAFLYRIDDLQHAYERFRFTSDVVKPPFDEVYSSVRSFIKDVLPKEDSGK